MNSVSKRNHEEMRIPTFIILLGISLLTQTQANEDHQRFGRNILDYEPGGELEIIQSCDSPVYCQGDLLDTVQKFKINKDSKTFVDMTQKNPENVTLQNFENMMKSMDGNVTKEDVIKFVTENFVLENESDEWEPSDLNSSPAFLDRIRSATVKTFAQALVSLWSRLGRKIKDSVRKNPTQHSLIPLPNGFIVPGGRFREIYYWDSYWIIEGLIICEMTDTVKGMLENFVYLIKTYGLIPNGSRIYYINRSQPPLFTAMVGLYIDATNDIDWLKSNIEYIEQELTWWLDHRTLTFDHKDKQYRLAHYNVASNTPRPESYAEDLVTCSHFNDKTQKSKCYSSLKTGAESGWDFSLRWIFDERGGYNGDLKNIDTKRVLPVDLNAMLCQAFKLLSEFYGKVGNEEKKEIWAKVANEWLYNIETILYDREQGIWLDFDSKLKIKRPYFFVSNFAPLWTQCYNLNDKQKYGREAAEYMINTNAMQYLGGTPTSLNQTGEQWDFPNAWPPLQAFIVLGLQKTDDIAARKFAEVLANRWIAANIKGYAQSQSMYEKYDAVEPGRYGGGGEYTVQEGFGWSNGVALSFIKHFNSARIEKPILNQISYIVILSLLTKV